MARKQLKRAYAIMTLEVLGLYLILSTLANYLPHERAVLLGMVVLVALAPFPFLEIQRFSASLTAERTGQTTAQVLESSDAQARRKAIWVVLEMFATVLAIPLVLELLGVLPAGWAIGLQAATMFSAHLFLRWGVLRGYST